MVISLDFELFWGVADSRTIDDYRGNVEGVWEAIPKMLTLFQRYGVHATWATVGMLMCRNHAQWREIRPSILPGYVRQQCSTYALDLVAREHPKLFFARPLVERILSTPGQELASHTYSHFYCDEEGVTPEQFSADLACARQVASEMGVNYRSLVLPRNQVRPEFIDVLTNSGLQVYRGNQDHWLYRNGHFTPGGLAGRAVKLADSYFPLTGAHCTQPIYSNGLTNLPASHFLRPWSRRLAVLEPLRLARLKQAMTEAAGSGRVCHLWWHPHNFGINVEQNIAVLESLLQHYLELKDRYGMHSLSMGDMLDIERRL
ncbi:MAG: polysaccharide deacetylase family protein [Nitrososphaera sp.]